VGEGGTGFGGGGTTEVAGFDAIRRVGFGGVTEAFRGFTEGGGDTGRTGLAGVIGGVGRGGEGTGDVGFGGVGVLFFIAFSDVCFEGFEEVLCSSP